MNKKLAVAVVAPVLIVASVISIIYWSNNTLTKLKLTKNEEIATIALQDDGLEKLAEYKNIQKEIDYPLIFTSLIQDADQSATNFIAFTELDSKSKVLLEKLLPSTISNGIINKDSVLYLFQNKKYDSIEKYLNCYFRYNSITVSISNKDNLKRVEGLDIISNIKNYINPNNAQPWYHTGAGFTIESTMNDFNNIYLYNPKLVVNDSDNSLLTINSSSLLYVCDTLSPLVVGNYFITDDYFMVAINSNDIVKSSASLGINEDDFYKYLKDYVGKRFDLGSRKLVFFNELNHEYKLPDYHLDMFFSPIPNIEGKKACVFSDSGLVSFVGGGDEPEEVVYYRKKLQIFKDSFLVKYFDTFINVPTVFYDYDKGKGSPEKFDFANFVYGSTDSSINFLFPHFTQNSNNNKPMDFESKFDDKIDSLEPCITATFSQLNFGNKKIRITFVKSYPFERKGQGFIHCNFFPIYKNFAPAKSAINQM